MPNETPNFDLDPEEVHRIMSNWQEDGYLKGMVRRDSDDRIDEVLESTDRMHQISDELKAQREEEAPVKIHVRFEPPPQVQAMLQAKQENFESEWERRSAMSQDSGSLIRDKLASKGITKVPELEDPDPEIEKISSRAQALDASKLHDERSKHSKRGAPKRYGPRDKGAPPHIAREIRGY